MKIIPEHYTRRGISRVCGVGDSNSVLAEVNSSLPLNNPIDLYVLAGATDGQSLRER